MKKVPLRILFVYPEFPKPGRFWSNCGRARCLHFIVPECESQCLAGTECDPRPRINRDRTLVRFANGPIANTADTGGVAFMAHIGGFVAGFVLTFLFRGNSRARLTA